ncbi:MAG: polymerase [Treponema sp.]|jgi:hypothetical protein|nr:polymerase [Treponema sp.]
MRKLTTILLIVFAAAAAFADAKYDINGSVEWDTLQIKAAVSMELASAGIKLPAGRFQGEALVYSGYLKMIRSGILDVQVDSSSTIGDLVERGEFSLADAETLALQAKRVPAVLSPDFKNMLASYTLNIAAVSSALLRHEKPSQIMRTLNPIAAQAFTGIIIIASESLPAHGMKSSALPVPCLFPKIWDTEMNLVYERNMFELKNAAMASYSHQESIFQNNPSGLSDDLKALVGERPLRIFARGVFGTKPTDLIIDREDARTIISSNENRRLLSEGRVAIILDSSVLRQKF